MFASVLSNLLVSVSRFNVYIDRVQFLCVQIVQGNVALFVVHSYKKSGLVSTICLMITIVLPLLLSFLFQFSFHFPYEKQ